MQIQKFVSYNMPGFSEQSDMQWPTVKIQNIMWFWGISSFNSVLLEEFENLNCI